MAFKKIGKIIKRLTNTWWKPEHKVAETWHEYYQDHNKVEVLLK